MTADLAAALQAIRDMRAEARALGVELIGVVGSVARGDSRPDSDVDIIARRSGKTTLFRIARMEAQLSLKLGRSVDLVFSEAMRPESRAFIERDLVLA